MNFHYIYHSGLLGAACLLSPAYSGLMADSIDLQTYRDFAENRGVFGINEKDVPIYDKEGNYVGTIPRMMNLTGWRTPSRRSRAGGRSRLHCHRVPRL